MPRDLFGDLHVTSVRHTTRSRYTVPVSLGLHVAAVAALVAASVLAPAVLPAPSAGEIILLANTRIPEPPPVRLAPDPKVPVPTVNPSAAPAVAPDSIVPEPEADYSLPAWTTSATGIIPGISGFDTVVGEPPPPPPSAPERTYRPGGNIKAPVKVHDVAPIYPPLALAARQEGMVIIEATIDRDGRIAAARVLRSLPLLDEAALEAVRQWVYSPTLLNGVPVPVVMTVTVSFALR